MRHRIVIAAFAFGLAACAHGGAGTASSDGLKDQVLALMHDLTPEISRCVPKDYGHMPVRFTLDLTAGRIADAEAQPEMKSVCDGVQLPGASDCSVPRRTVIVREAPTDPAVNECVRRAAVGKAAPRGNSKAFTVTYPFAPAG